MHASLGLAQSPKDLQGQLLDSRRQTAGADHCFDVMQMAMGVLGFVLDPHMLGSKSLPFDRFNDQLGFQPQRVDRGLDLLGRETEIDHRGEEHIAGNSAEAVDLQDSHRSGLKRRVWLAERKYSWRFIAGGESRLGVLSPRLPWGGCGTDKSPPELAADLRRHAARYADECPSPLKGVSILASRRLAKSLGLSRGGVNERYGGT